MKSYCKNMSSVRRFVTSVDVDGWSSLLRFYSVDHNPSEADQQVNVEDGIEMLLNLFKRREVKATFFVTGEMAQRHCEKIRAIVQNGHEVACHGFYHEKNECLLGKEKQRVQIERAVRAIENATGMKPLGFRAPCLRANNATLEILSEIGFLYDSSFLSMFVPGGYGSLSFFKFKPYYPLSERGELLEIPVSTNPVVPLPLSGSWMRNLGLSWVKFGIRTLFNLGYPVMFYLHPRDVLSLPLTPGVPWHVYRNTGRYCLKMLDKLLGYVERLDGETLRAIDLVSELKFARKLEAR